MCREGHGKKIKESLRQARDAAMCKTRGTCCMKGLGLEVLRSFGCVRQVKGNNLDKGESSASS